MRGSFYLVYNSCNVYIGKPPPWQIEKIILASFEGLCASVAVKQKGQNYFENRGRHFALTNWVSETISCPFVSLEHYLDKDRENVFGV